MNGNAALPEKEHTLSQTTVGQSWSAQSPAGPEVEQMTKDVARSYLPKRAFGTHKWDVGGLLIVAGSPTYVGAVALAGMAAQRAGAGVIQLAVPRGIISPLVPIIPEATYIPLPETESVSGARNAVTMIAEKGERASALLIGPGLGQDESVNGLMGALFGAPAAVRSIGFGGPSRNDSSHAGATSSADQPLARLDRPMVIDADGLNWLADQDEWPNVLRPESAVLTPHPGEMARLLQVEVSEVINDPASVVKEAARRWRQVVVLKFGYTAVSDGMSVRVAPSAPASLATAGTGDVLAGTIAALVAQGVARFDAAALGIYLGCQAAMNVQQRTSTFGLIASDLPLAVAAELAQLENDN